MHQSATSLTIVRSSSAWKRVEEHYGAAWRFGRQAIEEAWRCGDALIVAKAETKHGEWLPALKAVGITHDTAARLMKLRSTFADISQLAKFDTVSAALQLPQAQQHKPLSTKVRDPQPVFEAFRILDDILTKNSMSDCGLHFCVWFANGDGINRWMTVEFSVRSYADALQTAIKKCGPRESSRTVPGC